MNRICDFYVFIKNVFRSHSYTKRDYELGVRERTLEIKRERLFQSQDDFNNRNAKIIQLGHNKKIIQKEVSDLYSERDSLISSINKMKNIPEDDPKDEECQICFHIYSSCISKKIFPCGHDVCKDCSEQIDICPFCRLVL